MNKIELQQRTKRFALSIIEMANNLPYSTSNKVISNQILRSSTSIAANYRASCKAKSKADFVYKINLVEEEADETCFWLELLYENNQLSVEQYNKLHKEADELTAIFTVTGRTARNNLKSTNHPK
ncbi:four helix bundle protein [bacterium]|nr:MAG: four helix bundle protein [bacterium]